MQDNTIDHITQINAQFEAKVTSHEKDILQLRAEKIVAQKLAAENAENLFQQQLFIAEKEQNLSESLVKLAEVKAKLKEYTGCIDSLKGSLSMLEVNYFKNHFKVILL